MAPPRDGGASPQPSSDLPTHAASPSQARGAPARSSAVISRRTVTGAAASGKGSGQAGVPASPPQPLAAGDTATKVTRNEPSPGAGSRRRVTQPATARTAANPRA